MHVNELAAESIFIDDREFYNENSRDSHNLCEANTKIFTIIVMYEYSVAQKVKSHETVISYAMSK